MLRFVFIRENLPRTINSFNSTFVEGLQLQWIFGYLFLFIAVILLLVTLKFRLMIPSLILIGIASMGILMVQKTRTIGAEREAIFLNGHVVKATVIEHGKKINFLRLKRDYAILVTVHSELGEIPLEITNKREGLWKTAPIDSEILGIEYNGEFFFCQEMGCQFGLFAEKNEG